MSPEGQVRSVKPAAPSNIYTVLAAAVFALVLATAAYVAFECYMQFGTLFKIP